MAGRVVLYFAFAFFGVIAFLATTSDASNRTTDCRSASTALLTGLEMARGRIDAAKTDDPVKGAAALLDAAAVYDAMMGELQRLKIGAHDVQGARNDVARAMDQLHGWLVTYAQAVQKGDLQNIKAYRGNVDNGVRDVDANVKRLREICVP